MIWVSYDIGLAYPQPALFGLGIVHKDGTHTPSPGLSSFGVDEETLAYGLDERFYEVTAVDTLTDKDQTDVDDILLDDYKDAAYPKADAEALKRQREAEANPSIGTTLDDRGVKRENRRRDNKAKRKVNAISDADDHLYDHIDKLYDTADLIRDDIESAVDIAGVDVVVAAIPTDVRWPSWSPIA
jgi:hypothetical protein